MPVQQYQCNGTTKAGKRCRITVNRVNGYCHHHEYQAKKITNAFQFKENSTSGYIYMYTYTNFITKKTTPFSFEVKNLPNGSTRNKDEWIAFKAKKSPYILIKIGRTTKSVNQRLKEWENQCHHKVTNLGPMNRDLILKQNSSVKGLISKFLGLKITPNNNAYQRYKNEGFYCNQNLNLVEEKIHKSLRKIYGKGDVYCQGCVKPDAIEKTGAPFSKYNTHTEFFLIPKKNINSIYELIDSICVKYG